MRGIRSLLIDLPIVWKLLLASGIPVLALILLSIMTYQSVKTVSQDQENLDQLYVTQKTAAQYMRLVVDIETGFRGYVLTEEVSFLRPYRIAQEGIAFIGHDLEMLVAGEQREQIKEIQSLVKQLLSEKDELIQAVRSGYRQKALHYIEAGRGRVLMTGIRDRIAHFDQLEQQRVSDRLSRLSQDRTSTLYIILGGGIITFALMVCALYVIARSIAVPLVGLAKVVGSPSSGTVPAIPVLDRRDEIGDLTRVMHEMGGQIGEHLASMKKSEAALRELNTHLSVSESKYRGLVDHAPIGIFTTTGMEITFSNRYNQLLAGLDPDSPGDPASFLHRIHPEDRDRVLAEVSQAVAEGRSHETVFRFLHTDGVTRTILSRRIPVTDRGIVPPVYVGFNIDITALDDLRSRLSRSEKLATLGQVAAGIAHEIRNPLVGIGSTASLLLDEFEVSDARRTDVDSILKETRRLDRIVSQIVEYARPRHLVVVPFTLRDLIDEVVKLLAMPLQTKHLKVAISISPTLPLLHGDRDQIKQVLLNVLQNAVDASAEDGDQIEIAGFELNQYQRPGVMLRVKDAGIGISPEALPHVFEPFFTKGKRHGTGLGLAISRNIAESHGGEMHMTSEVGKGTVVRIWLPLSQDLSVVKG